MDDKIKILLDKIHMDEKSYPYFSDAKMTKIKVNSKIDSWQIFIEKDNLLPIEIYEELENKKMSLDEQASKIDIIFDIKYQNIEEYLNYYQKYMKIV